MKKFLILAVFLSFLSYPGALAQPTVSLTSAKVKFESGEYEDALSSVNKALDGFSELMDNDKSEVWMYKGKCLFQLYNIALSSADEEMQKKYGNSLHEAFRAFEKSLQYADERQMQQIDREMNALYLPLLQTGLTLLNYASTGNLDSATQKTYLEYTLIYLESALKIEDSYLPYDLRGQALMLLGDSLDAGISFGNSMEWYSKSKPAQPDMLIGYVYYRKGILDRYFTKDNGKALRTIETGIAVLDEEMKRLDSDEAGPIREKYDQARAQYLQVKEDMNNFRLDIMMNDPDLLEHALAEFEKALKEDPGNYNKLVAYANLLEKSDIEKAIAMYLKAVEVDPANDHAWFNLGVIYNNKGLEYLIKANETASTSQAVEYEALANSELEKAAGYFKKALDCDPNSLESVKALKNIYLRLDKMEEWKLYDEIEKRIKQ